MVTQTRICCALLMTFTMVRAHAEEIIKLNMSDIAFQWPAPPEGAFLCGYAIQGNRHSWKNPRTGRDINIDEVVQGDSRAVGVRAGSFVVTGKSRIPRSPITDLVLTTEDEAEPFPAQLVGVPNKDNGVRGKMDLERAPKLFKALSNGRRIDLVLQYADGTSDGRTPVPGSGLDIRVGAH